MNTVPMWVFWNSIRNTVLMLNLSPRKKGVSLASDSENKAEEFLSISSQYKLGNLVTESAHRATRNLSSLASNNLPEAISILKELDRQTIRILSEKKKEICYLKDIIRDTLKSGNNIFFCGCGATGRLSLTIETLWRQVHERDNIKERVLSFMSGGDVALIRSIENFEDFPQYGARQLLEAGLKDGDLLIGCTEGGETPFVIGAVEKATQISKRKPFFMYCNPDDLLFEVAERSKRVIQNPGIEKINLTVGPMAVTGSTRMQSSTILLAAAGIALYYYNESNETIDKEIDAFTRFWDSADIKFIEKFIIQETDYYLNGEYLLYETDNQLGITVITDTTERSPTFSLFPFENVYEADQNLSLCYLFMPDAKSSEEAWEKLLWRTPRTLEWPEISGIASSERLLGFDFSRKVLSRREHQQKSLKQHRFRIMYDQKGINFLLGNERYFLATPFSNPLFTHLVLKMILNAHSTLIMGRLGRYEGNIMTYVRASNNKLIDRAIRYIDLLLENKRINLSYSALAYILFEMIEKTPADQSIVLATVAEIEKRFK
jgi:N-acetylmuramic acid 6-phosphate etherase